MKPDDIASLHKSILRNVQFVISTLHYFAFGSISTHLHLSYHLNSQSFQRLVFAQAALVDLLF